MVQFCQGIWFIIPWEGGAGTVDMSKWTLRYDHKPAWQQVIGAGTHTALKVLQLRLRHLEILGTLADTPPSDLPDSWDRSYEENIRLTQAYVSSAGAEVFRGVMHCLLLTDDDRVHRSMAKVVDSYEKMTTLVLEDLNAATGDRAESMGNLLHWIEDVPGALRLRLRSLGCVRPAEHGRSSFRMDAYERGEQTVCCSPSHH